MTIPSSRCERKNSGRTSPHVFTPQEGTQTASVLDLLNSKENLAYLIQSFDKVTGLHSRLLVLAQDRLDLAGDFAEEIKELEKTLEDELLKF